MKHPLIIAGLLLLASPMLAQDLSEQAAQVRWMKHMTPGVAHQRLATTTGKFKAVYRFWMDPNAEPAESEGIVENTMLLGGRYQRATYTGNIMGMVFEGVANTGFDNKKNVFQMNWIDNMGTSMSTLTGTYDEATHTITYSGIMYDAITDQDNQVKMVMRFESKDKYILDMYMTGDVKTMEIIHTRAE